MKKLLVAIFILFAVPFSSHAAEWAQTGESGLGITNNSAATLFKNEGKLYAITDNTNGVRGYAFSESNGWEEVENWPFLSDQNNIQVTAKRKFKGEVYLGILNRVTGGEVWRFNADGSWSQVNYDGFGNPVYKEIAQLVNFKGRLVAYVQNNSCFAECGTNVRVLRMPENRDARSWEFLADLPWGTFEGLDGAEAFKGSIFLANKEGATVWKSDDGITYTAVSNIPGTVAQLKKISIRGRIYAITLGGALWSSADGITWNLISNRPYGDAYHKLVPKPHVDRLAMLGDVDAASAYIRKDSSWSTKTDDGFGNQTNERFSDGVWFQHKLWVASENTTEGTEIFRQP